MKEKISAIAVMVVIFFQFWPQQTGKSQVNSDSILSQENQRLMKLRDAMIDSINATVARVEHKQQEIKAAKRDKKRNHVAKHKTVIKKVVVHDTVAVYKTKWMPSTVDKADYWKRQREFTDSLANKDKPVKRGFFKRLFGVK